jgi:uncharacterized membrane protein YdjX (TVP38/TMEM64 family)
MTMSKTTVISTIRIVTLIALGGLCVALYPAINQENLSEFISRNGLSAPLIFIAICAFRPVLFFLPSMGLTIIAGALFGALWGTIYVAIGGALSTVIGYYFARWYGRSLLENLLKSNHTLRRIDVWSKKHGKNAVLLMRICNLPWDMVSYWAGLTNISFRDFYIASLIALLPFSFLYTYFGTQVFTPKSAGFLISLVIILIMGSLPYILNLRKKNTNDQ